MDEKKEAPQPPEFRCGGCTVKAIMAYVRSSWRKLLLIGGISLLCFLALFILLIWLMPHETAYVGRYNLLLERRGGDFRYPNGKRFSPQDVLSPLVLESVYRQFKKNDQDLPFAEFNAALSIANGDSSGARIEEEFAETLSKRDKMSVVELNRIENDFIKKLERAKKAELVLSISVDVKGMTPQKAEQELNAILEIWYTLYSKMEARTFPRIEIAEQLKNLHTPADRKSFLISLEKARMLSRELQSMCSLLNSMQQGKNCALPSGETLGDLIKQIEAIRQYKIDVFRQYVLLHPELQYPLDRIYLESSLQRVENSLMREKMIGKGIENALDIVTDRTPDIAGGAPKVTMSGDTVQQMDVSLFNSIAELIRNDVNAKVRKEYSAKILKNKENCAELEGEKSYYQRLLDQRRPAHQRTIDRRVTIPAQQLNSQIEAMFSELQEVSMKLIRMRELVQKNYLASRKFYSVAQSPQKEIEYIFSLKKIGRCMIVLWALLFCIFVCTDFLRRKRTGILPETCEKKAKQNSCNER